MCSGAQSWSGACEHQLQEGVGEGAREKLEPAGCLPALCPPPPFHPGPRSLGVSQWSRREGNALQGAEKDGLRGGHSKHS